MAGIPMVTDSDAMSGIEPLASGSSVDVSPAPEGRSVSVQSSTNTAELLASTLYSVDSVSDPEDLSKREPTASVGLHQSGHRHANNRNPQWRDEDGQTVSSIFSPLSEMNDGTVRSLTKQGGSIFDRAGVDRSQSRRIQQTGNKNQTSQSKSAHHSLPSPYGRLAQPDGMTPKSLPFQSDRFDGEEDSINQTVLDRKREFVSKFGSRGTESNQYQVRQSVTAETKVVGSLNSYDDPLDQFKDYEEQRLSADSTLTEHLLRGITPTDQISPFSAPYNSGLPSDLQSIQVGTQSHTISMRSESYLAQENLEKERYRRKHCELQIRELHSKLMESQQLLAVAEATRRKKDSMIEQIEKNFSKVMSDWKTKDKEKLESLEGLKRDADKYQHLARMREQELEVREKENTELRLSKDTLQTELVQVREESSSQHEEQREKMKVTIREMENAVQERVAAEQHVKKVQDILAKERSEWREKEANFTDKLVTLEKEISEKHREFQRTMEKEAEAAQQLISENEERRKRIAQLQDQISKMLQEKESLSLEMSLKEAQFEASLQKQEMDWKEQMERLIQERTASIQDDASHQLEDQRAGHHAQVTNLTKQHQEEVRRLREEHSSDVKMREERYRSSQEQLQEELEHSNQKIHRLSLKLEEVQRHRSLIIQKLQSCLQSYASDSLMMLGQLNSSPATSNTQVYTQDGRAATPKTSLCPPVPKTVDEQFIQLMTTLSSDGGYQSLPSNVNVPVGHMLFNQGSHWAGQPMAPGVHDQPPPVRYDTVMPVCPSKQGVLSERKPTEGHDQPSQSLYNCKERMNNSDHAGGSWQTGWSNVVEERGEDPRRGPTTGSGGQTGHGGVTHRQDQAKLSLSGRQGIDRVHYQSSYGRDAQARTDYPTDGAAMSYHNAAENSGNDQPTLIPQEREDSRDGPYVHAGQMRPGGRRDHYRYETAEMDDTKRSEYQGEEAERNTSKLSEHYFESQGNASKRTGCQHESQIESDTSRRSDHSRGYDESLQQSNTSKRSELSYHTSQSSRLSHYEDGHQPNQFQPLRETDDMSLSEHPLDTTGQSLGDISQRLGKEEDRRQLLQHYLKELLDQATEPGQSQILPTQPQAGEIPQSRTSMKRSSHPQLQGNSSHSQRTSISSAPERQRPASNSPIHRDIVPVKERTVPRKHGSNKSSRSSAENSSRSSQRLSDESRAGRRSANPSAHQVRLQPNKEQSLFGTSTPKKKGGPRPNKPPMRKVKPGKPKPGVWK